MDHRSSARPQIPQRQAASSQPPAGEYVPEQRAPKQWTPSIEPKRRKKWPLYGGILAAIVVIVLVAWFLMPKGVAGGGRTPDPSRFQAVFLDNGQVFFGKLKNTDGTYLVLEDAYYTQKQELPANASEKQKAAVQNNVSLAKVGSEVYGPETSMSIRAEQVLFWQNLKSDSKDANAIKSAQ